MKSISQYADEIMSMIALDAEDRPGLKTARSFIDLHDHVDANEYMIDALIPYDPDDVEIMAFYVAVQDEVTKRLEAMHGIGPKRLAHTIVATVARLDDVESFAAAFRALLAQHGAELIPCNWAPDPESVADYVPNIDEIDLIDMNPGAE